MMWLLTVCCQCIVWSNELRFRPFSEIFGHISAIPIICLPIVLTGTAVIHPHFFCLKWVDQGRFHQETTLSWDGKGGLFLVQGSLSQRPLVLFHQHLWFVFLAEHVEAIPAEFGWRSAQSRPHEHSPNLANRVQQGLCMPIWSQIKTLSVREFFSCFLRASKRLENIWPSFSRHENLPSKSPCLLLYCSLVNSWDICFWCWICVNFSSTVCPPSKIS